MAAAHVDRRDRRRRCRVGAHDRRRGRGRGPQGRRRPRRRPARGQPRRDAGGAAGHQPDTAPRLAALPADTRPLPAVSRLRPAAHAGPAPARKASHDPRHRGITEQAADAAVDTACRVLRLPTIRAQFTDARRQAAEREQLTYRGFLAELLMAECEDRDRRRAERQIKAPGSPAQKWLRDFDFDANPGINPAVDQHPGHLRLGPQRPAALPDRRLRHRQVPPAHRPGHRRGHGRATGSATPWPPSSPTSSSRPPTTGSSPRPSPATAASTCSASTSSATWNSTAAAPSCCSRS